MTMTPRRLRVMINLYPPYLGAGIRMESLSGDFRHMTVSMKLRWYNRNANGVHFGGSLFSMVDPHLILMLMGILGGDYALWDKAAAIEFYKPGRGKVTAEFHISDELLAEIRERTQDGGKFLPELTIPIKDETGDVVAQVQKTLYIRRKRPDSQDSPA